MALPLIKGRGYRYLKLGEGGTRLRPHNLCQSLTRGTEKTATCGFRRLRREDRPQHQGGARGEHGGNRSVEQANRVVHHTVLEQSNRREQQPGKEADQLGLLVPISSAQQKITGATMSENISNPE